MAFHYYDNEMPLSAIPTQFEHLNYHEFNVLVSCFSHRQRTDYHQTLQPMILHLVRWSQIVTLPQYLWRPPRLLPERLVLICLPGAVFYCYSIYHEIPCRSHDAFFWIWICLIILGTQGLSCITGIQFTCAALDSTLNGQKVTSREPIDNNPPNMGQLLE